MIIRDKEDIHSMISAVNLMDIHEKAHQYRKYL
jgi:hypothetical protein